MKLYEVGCIIKEVQPKNGVKITLEEAQALVDGYVELVIMITYYCAMKKDFSNINL